MDLQQFLQPGALTVFVLVALRTTGAFAVGPLASWPGVPLSARILLGVGIALALAPSVPIAVPLAQLRPGLPDLIGELLLGLVLGVASSLLVSAVQLAAGLVDVQAGFTFGATLDPFAGYAAGPIEHFLSAFAIVLFLNLNGHQLFLVALHDLFVIAPIGGLPHLASAGAVSGFFAVIFIAALTMALPIVTMILLIDVALALLSRAAPQFNLFAVGLPARAGVTLVVLATLLPVIATQLGQLYSQLPNVLPVVTRQ